MADETGNTYNYAEKYSSDLIDIINQGSLTSPFLVSNVDWMGAKVFHFTYMSVSGFKGHTDGSWNTGHITQGDKAYEVTHDRDILIPVDKNKVDTTNRTAAIENIASIFTKTQMTPEVDAYFFSKIAAEAINAQLNSKTPLADYTSENVYQKLLAGINKPFIKRHRQRGSIVMYVRSEIMDLLELAKDFTRSIEVTTLTEDGRGVETRVTSINGVTLIEVIDTNRFATKFNFTDGFVKASDGKDINYLIACLETCKTVPKFESIYFKNPGDDLLIGDSYGFAMRALWDTFVLPNGIDGKVDSIFVDTDEAKA